MAIKIQNDSSIDWDTIQLGTLLRNGKGVGMLIHKNITENIIKVVKFKNEYYNNHGEPICTWDKENCSLFSGKIIIENDR